MPRLSDNTQFLTTLPLWSTFSLSFLLILLPLLRIHFHFLSNYNMNFIPSLLCHLQLCLPSFTTIAEVSILYIFLLYRSPRALPPSVFFFFFCLHYNSQTLLGIVFFPRLLSITSRSLPTAAIFFASLTITQTFASLSLI